MKVYSKAASKKAIIELVNDFDNKIDYHKSDKYNESEVEKDFIRPLFDCLNWNTTNRGLDSGKTVFVVQKSVSNEKFNNNEEKNKRPDYLLKVPDKNSNSMKSVFYIEAKRPHEKLKTDIKHLRQVYRYAWSTLNSSDNPNNQVRMALLTDFEEFRFFDCQDGTPIDQGRAELFNKRIIKDWTYKEYVTKFDELWDLFEYNNVVNGSLEEWYLTSKQLADNRITPDKLFLEDLRKWRLDIARSMYKNDKSLDDFKLTKATLLYINRIIFVKMLADRNIEPDYLTKFLTELNKSKKTELKLYELCKTIFERLDHIYNGSIFAYDNIADELVIDNSVLKNIFLSLDPDKSIYTLAAMPVEIIGNVYELLIAEQIVKKGSTISIVSRYDEKKAGGVYYTPRYIVEYIVDNTLGKKLEECKNPEDAEKIKVLDPACGSGSFLIVAYQKLLDWHKKWMFDTLKFVQNQAGNSKYHEAMNQLKKIGRFENTNQNDFHNISLTHKHKSQILMNCIFGVDIDPQAVMVTKFSLSLKALEDSTKDEVIIDNELFKIPVLPKLENNIKCGNSLIGGDFYKDNKPSLFNEKEKRKINTFDWDKENGFESIMQSGGFDVVIGNPPYVSIRNLTLFNNENVKEYFSANYLSAFKGYDLYVLFIEKSIKLLGKNGLLGFITPNKFTVLDYGEKIREIILKNHSIIELVDVSSLNIFPTASVYPYIVILDKLKKNKHFINILVCKKYTDLIENKRLQILQSNFLEKKGFLISLNSDSINFKFSKTITLDKVCKVQAGTTGFLATKTKDCIIDNSEKGLDFIVTGSIDRYSIVLGNVRYINKKFEKPKLINKNNIITKGKWHLFNSKKIVIGGMTKVIEAAYDNIGLAVGVGVYCLTDFYSNNPYFILGLLNSKFITYYFRKEFEAKHLAGGYLAINSGQLAQLPIPIIDFSNKKEKSKHDKLIELVEQMLENQKYQHEAKTESDKKMYGNICISLDKQIDKLVYELYELTEDEIKIVEGE